MIATEPLQARPLAAGTDPPGCRVEECGRAAVTRGLCGVHYSRLRYSTDAAERSALEAAALPSRQRRPDPGMAGRGGRPPGAAQGRAAQMGGLAAPECLVGMRGEGVERNGVAARPLSVCGFMLAPPTGRLTPKQEAERARLLELYCRRTAEGSHIRTGEPLTADELRSIDGGGIGPDEQTRAKMAARGKEQIAVRRAELVRLAGPDAEARLPELLRGVWREWAGGLSIRELAARVGLTLGAAASRLYSARRALGLPPILGDGRLAGGAA